MNRNASRRWYVPSNKIVAIALALCTVALLVGSVAGGLMNRAENADADDHREQVEQLFSLSSDQYPTVVARVNGQDISGQALAQRVFFLEQNPPLGGLGGLTPEDVALKRLIEEQVLLDQAEQLGVKVSEKEARQEAENQEKVIREMAGEKADEVLATYAAQLGVSADEFMTHPSTIEAIRISMTLARVQAKLNDSAGGSKDSQTFTANYQAELDAFVRDHTDSLEIYIESSLD